MTHLIYSELAEWWPLLSRPADYADEASDYTRALQRYAQVPVRSLLELGSGGGNNASHMKASFERLTLVDLSERMLAVSRGLNPDCAHVAGDMRTVRLGRDFDAVFVHDAICYMTTVDDVAAVAETAFVHCRPGGAAIFAPDHVGGTIVSTTSHGGHDGEDGRGLCYLEWAWDPDPSDTTYLVDYALLVRSSDGSTEVRHDRHVEGLFPESTWLDVLRPAGFEPTALTSVHSEHVAETRMFVGVKPVP